MPTAISALLRTLALLGPLATVALASDDADAAASRKLVLTHATTPWFVPKATTTDKDFYGHGPDTRVEVQLFVRNERELWARVKMRARETTNDWTTAEETRELLVNALPAGLYIDAILTPTAATLTYVDRDHEEDYLVPGRGEARPERWRLPPSTGGPVRMARIIGDTEGGEAGTRTGVQFFFEDIELSVHGVAPNPVKKLVVSEGEREAFPNGCAASAGWRVLDFYGKSITHEQFYERVTSSHNFVSDNNWGVPPGTLRDRLRDAGADVQEHRMATKAAAIETVVRQIDLGRPVIALTGWGGKNVLDVYEPVGDTLSWDFGATALHYVVIRGYDRQQKLLHVLDNGRPKVWTYAYFQTLLFWSAEPHATALFDTVNVRNATLIY